MATRVMTSEMIEELNQILVNTTQTPLARGLLEFLTKFKDGGVAVVSMESFNDLTSKRDELAELNELWTLLEEVCRQGRGR